MNKKNPHLGFFFVLDEKTPKWGYCSYLYDYIFAPRYDTGTYYEILTN